MKKIAIFSCCLVAMTLLIGPSCKKFQDLAAFDVRYTIPRTTFTYTPTAFKEGEQLLYSGSVEANLDSIMSSHGVSSGIVGETRFLNLTVTIAQPGDLTFSWLRSARAELSKSPGFEPAQEVGYVTNADPMAQTVSLTLLGTNLRPYLGDRFFYVRIFGELTGPLPVEWVEMYIDGQMLMHIEPL